MATEDLQRASRKGRPNHPLEFKRRLAQAACAPGISVAKWRRHYRAEKFGALDQGAAAAVAPTPSPAAPFQLLPVIESMVPVTVDAGTRQAPSEDGIEVVFPAATVRVGCGLVPG